MRASNDVRNKHERADLLGGQEEAGQGLPLGHHLHSWAVNQSQQRSEQDKSWRARKRRVQATFTRGITEFCSNSMSFNKNQCLHAQNWIRNRI